ncbi:MAG: hypothetical protein KC591_17390 [Gemmatimonadetes bacterium]|nr:hypothetical protein [Gemmatimonadota bacterium]
MRFPFLAVALLGARLLVPDFAPALSGDLDPTFAADGLSRLAISDDDDDGSAVVVQPDGNVLVAGSTVFGGRRSMSFVRYHADGSLDPTFGNAGQATVPFPGGQSSAEAVRLQSDGKIVAAGTVWYDGFTYPQFAVVRLNADGTPDPSFAGQGLLSVNMGGLGASASDLRVQTDGKIVVVGYSIESADQTDLDFAVLRIDSAGLLDPAFDGDGRQVVSFGAYRDVATSVVVLGTTVVAAGYQEFFGGKKSVALVRLTGTGALDPTFDGDGKVTTDILGRDDRAASVALSASSLIFDTTYVVTGSAYDISTSKNRIAVCRYTSTGALDTTWGGTGKVVTSIATASAGRAVLVESVSQFQRKVVIAGYYYTVPALPSIFVARYLFDGTLDSSFNGAGIASAYPGTACDCSDLAVLGGSGSYTVAGWARPTGDDDFMTIRFTHTGPMDTSFDVDGTRFDNFGTQNAVARDLAIQPDGKIVTVGERKGGRCVLARQEPDGTLDPTFGVGGISILDSVASSLASGHALVRLDDGRLLVAGNSPAPASTFGVARLDATGSLDPSFGGGGAATASPGPNSHCIGVAATVGKIWLAGDSQSAALDWRGFSMARFDSDGSLDFSFSGDGSLVQRIGLRTDAQAHAMALLSNGKVLIAGESLNDLGGYDLTVARFLQDGSFDLSFNGQGVAIPFLLGDSRARALLVQPDGRIVVGGSIDSGPREFLLARFLPDGFLDVSFGDGGVVTTGFSGAAEVFALAPLPDGRLLATGTCYQGYDDEQFAVARYRADGTLDGSWGIGGTELVPFAATVRDTARAVALDDQGRVVIAGEVGGLYAVARLEGDFATAAPLPGIAAERLLSVGPNPFRGEARIRFAMPAPGPATLRAYGVDGRLVATVAEGVRDAGEQSVLWSGTDDRGRPLAAGVYYLRLVAGGSRSTERVVLVR